MTRARCAILLILVALTFGSYKWITERSTGMQSYKWFQSQIAQQKLANGKMIRTNQRMRQEIMALRYDHRLIEREARDMLTLTREGEIIVHLPR